MISLMFQRVTLTAGWHAACKTSMSECRDQAAAFSRVEMMMTLAQEVSRKLLRMVRLRKILQVMPIGFAPKMHVEFNKDKGAKNDSKVFGLNK